MGNLAAPLSSLVSSNLAAAFHLYGPDRRLLTDESAGRRMLTLDTLIVALNLLAVPCILILPSQKTDIQALLASNARSPRMAQGLLVVLAVFLVWSVLGNLLAIFPSTACLTIIGGSGC